MNRALFLVVDPIFLRIMHLRLLQVMSLGNINLGLGIMHFSSFANIIIGVLSGWFFFKEPTLSAYWECDNENQAFN